MTITQDQQQALKDNWDAARERIEGEFPGLQEVDLSEYRADLSQQVAQVTNTGVSEVESKFSAIAREVSADQDDEMQTTEKLHDQGQMVQPAQPSAQVREGNAPKRG